jgi:hypothetical protein
VGAAHAIPQVGGRQDEENCRVDELFRDAVLFVLRAQNAVDRVGGTTAGFVVVANLHFAEQADREKIEASDKQS